MAAEYETHPAAELMPEMSADEYAALKADIEANGVHEPVWLYEGRVIDGRHRLRACNELGIDPPTQTYEGEDATGFVLSLNVNRRQLTKSQLAAIGVELLPDYEGQAKARQGSRTDLTAKVPGSGEAREVVAQAVGVSARYISDAKRLTADDPAKLTALKAGRLTLRDLRDLAAMEQRLGRALSTMANTAWAAKAIRDGELFKPEYPTFEDYCAKRWPDYQGQLGNIIALVDEMEWPDDENNPTGEPN